VFPNAEKSACFFHFMQSNWRQLQSSGVDVIQRYRQDADYAAVCRLLTSLAFVPMAIVIDVFDIVVLHIEENYLELNDYCSYFESTYIGARNRQGPGRRAARFPIELWNMVGRVNEGIDRTNNAVDGWHRGLNTTLGVKHPSIWKFLDGMRHKVRFQEMLFEQQQAGREPEVQRSQWANLTSRLRRICARFTIGMDYIAYLKGVSNNFQF